MGKGWPILVVVLALGGCAAPEHLAGVPSSTVARPVAAPAVPAAAQDCPMPPRHSKHAYASLTDSEPGRLYFVAVENDGAGRCPASGKHATIYADVSSEAFAGG